MRKYKFYIIGFLCALAIIIVTGIIIWKGGLLKRENISAPKITADDSSPKDQLPNIKEYSVPVLMYHYVRDSSGESELGKNLSVSPANFQDQVTWLKENNYETLNVSDLADPKKSALNKIQSDNKKPIVLTFDDGYEDAYTQAFPVLQKNHFVATFYVVTDFTGTPNYMNKEQLLKLKAEGNEIGSHTLSHVDLTKVNMSEASRQILQSKEASTSFCYPSGKYNDQVVNEVSRAGYLDAVTTKSGIVNEKTNLFLLPRVRIQDEGRSGFERRIQQAYNVKE